MSDFINVTYPKARKQHLCDLCGKPINKGDTYTHHQGHYEDYFFTSKLHDDCCDIINQYCREGGEGWEPEGVNEWLADMYCDKDCPESNYNDGDCDFAYTNTSACSRVKKMFFKESE